MINSFSIKWIRVITRSAANQFELLRRQLSRYFDQNNMHAVI